jgi:hypothetical protein
MTREHISFNIVREEYSEYEIETGQRVRIKYTLTDVVREIKDSDQSLLLRSKDISVVVPAFDIDTSNMEYASTDQVTEKDIVKRYHFRPIKEIINIYEIEYAIILLACKTKEIALTNKKTKRTYLLYIIKRLYCSTLYRSHNWFNSKCIHTYIVSICQVDVHSSDFNCFLHSDKSLVLT